MAAGAVLLALAIADLYPVFIASVLLFGVGVPNLLFMRRRLRYPDTIIALLQGYITFFNSARLSEHPDQDQLQLRRFKKRKLMLKDSISRLKVMLVPDIPA